MKVKHAELQAAIDGLYAALANETPEEAAGWLAAMLTTITVEGGLSDEWTHRLIDQQIKSRHIEDATFLPMHDA